MTETLTPISPCTPISLESFDSGGFKVTQGDQGISGSKDFTGTQRSVASVKFVNVQGAIDFTLLGRVGKKTLFVLARALKAYECTTGSKIELRELDNIFDQWWHTAGPKLPARARYILWRAEFKYNFGLAKVPLLVQPLEDAAAFARTHESDASLAEAGALQLVCERLAEINGNGTFYLSARDAAKLLNFQASEAYYLLRELCSLGYIKLVEKGQGNQASTYRLLKRTAH